MNAQKLFRIIQIAALFSLRASVHSQPFATGDISQNFALPNYETSETVNLIDFEGKVIVLDFFAYWCGPCSVSSPDIEGQHSKILRGTWRQ